MQSLNVRKESNVTLGSMKSQATIQQAFEICAQQV
jgi:hypothetical protein